MTTSATIVAPTASAVLDRWLRAQSINVAGHVRSLRPFDQTEFGTGPAAPSPAQVDAVNALLASLRARVADRGAAFGATVDAARATLGSAELAAVLDVKQAITPAVLHVETVWDFYHDLFTQRLSAFGERLRAVDRICADCYEAVYLPLGRTVPPLLPFCFADTGFSPATFRRGVPLTKLRRHPNLFPLVTIPQHRLSNVWALSSVLHEVSHNLQADLGLWEVMPALVLKRLTAAGVPESVAVVWAKWHKEVSADLFALVLGGPAAVESLMDVVGRGRAVTSQFDPMGVHPTPYLRTLISTSLLHRLGLPALAASLEEAWRQLYPSGGAGIPHPLLATFQRACEIVVDTMVFAKHDQLSGRSLAEIVPFGPSTQDAIEAGGAALAEGRDPSDIAPRLLIGAARHAVEARQAPPASITETFYRALGRR